MIKINNNLSRVRIGTYFFATILLVLVAVAITQRVLTSPAHAASADHFVTTWKTDNPGVSNNSSITIPVSGGGYNYDVDWDNDGVFDQLGVTGSVTHDFGEPGTYTIRVQGEFPRINLGNSGTDRQKLLSIDQWGTGVWRSFSGAFYGATNLTIDATDAPDLTLVSDLRSMFENASSLNSDLSHWDTSNVTDMTGMFRGASSFNGDVGDWDTSNVTSMHDMFSGAASFNGDLSTWDTGSVTDMRGMFSDATSFVGGDLSQWDTSSVDMMLSMFYGASSFNGEIGDWDTSNVEYMNNMFYGAIVFNSDITSWDTSSVYNMQYMFRGAEAFDQNLGSWDVTSVEGMGWMLSLSGMSGDNYDATLQGWAGQALMPDVTLGADELVYCESRDDRQYIVDNYGWTFSGDIDCSEVGAEKAVTDVSFGIEDGRQLMRITGTALVSLSEAEDAYSRSLVSVNGDELPFCTYAGLTEEEFIEFLGVAPGMVSEGPSCYLVMSHDGMSIELTSTQAIVWLSDDFDATALGTVSVNGSPVFAFNQPDDENPGGEDEASEEGAEQPGGSITDGNQGSGVGDELADTGVSQLQLGALGLAVVGVGLYLARRI